MRYRSVLVIPVAALLACSDGAKRGGGFPGTSGSRQDATSGSDATGLADGASTDASGTDGASRDASSTADGGASDTGAGPMDASRMDAQPIDTGMAGSLDAAPNADASPPVDTGPRLDTGPGGQVCNSSFGANDACGGNVVGNWTYVEGCLDINAFSMLTAACPGIVISNQTQSTSGTLDIGANGVVSRNYSDVARATAAVPALCNIAGCINTASSVGAVVRGASAICIDDAVGGCNCDVTISRSTNDVGTYTVSNGTVTVTTQATQMYWFCISGNTLQYRGQPSNPEDNAVSYILAR